MKKLLFTLVIMIGLSSNAQTFIKNYNAFYSSKDFYNIKEQKEIVWSEVNLSVIFSGDDKGDIIFYYGDTAKRYHKTGKVVEGKTPNGKTYRYISCIEEAGPACKVLRYDTGALKVIYDDYFLEFHNLD